MLWHTGMKPRQLTLCGCSVLHVAARPYLSGNGSNCPARRRT
jgi:hypothetical protein